MQTVDNLLQQAIQTARDGDRAGARKLLSAAVRQDPTNPRAWYLLSQVVDQPDQVRFCLNKVLEIDPQHPKAIEKLATLNMGAGLDVQTPPPKPYSPPEPQFTPPPIETSSSAYIPPEVPSYSSSELPPQLPEAPYKKPPLKRKQKTDLFSLWMILALVGVLIVTCCCGGWWAITNNILEMSDQLIPPGSGGGFPVPANPGSAPSGGGAGQDVTLQVSGSFSQASITYNLPDGKIQMADYKIPWVKAYFYKSGATIFLTAQGKTGGDHIACNIRVNGKVVYQHSGTGASRVAMCMYNVP